MPANPQAVDNHIITSMNGLKFDRPRTETMALNCKTGLGGGGKCWWREMVGLCSRARFIRGLLR